MKAALRLSMALKVEVSLEMKADKEHVTLSRLRFVPQK